MYTSLAARQQSRRRSLRFFFENVVKHRKVLFQNKRHRDVHDVHAVCRDKL